MMIPDSIVFEVCITTVAGLQGLILQKGIGQTYLSAKMGMDSGYGSKPPPRGVGDQHTGISRESIPPKKGYTLQPYGH
jgi:hypothetical protein